jgi:hypothetical protein
MSGLSTEYISGLTLGAPASRSSMSDSAPLSPPALAPDSANAPPVGAASAAEAIATAHAARDADAAQRVAAGHDITSLNRLLQWGAANSVGTLDDGPSAESVNAAAAAAAARPQQPVRSPEELRKEREWLDAAFPDMFAEVKRLTKILAGEIPPPESAGGTVLDDDMRVDLLNALEEYMADLNFATNITSLGTLGPVVEHASHAVPDVRAAALWVLGTSMQDVSDVKAQVVAGGGVPPIVAGLADASRAVRAKATMAASALLRHADANTLKAFVDAKGVPELMRAIVDDAPPVRRRAQFFLQHAHTSGVDWFVVAVLHDGAIVPALAALLERVDLEDLGQVEAVVGALQTLATHDRFRILELAPTLPGIVEKTASVVTDRDTRYQVVRLADVLEPSLS